MPGSSVLHASLRFFAAVLSEYTRRDDDPAAVLCLQLASYVLSAYLTKCVIGFWLRLGVSYSQIVYNATLSRKCYAHLCLIVGCGTGSKELFKCLDVCIVHFGRQINADVAYVPRLIYIAGNVLHILWVANDKSVFVGVGG